MYYYNVQPRQATATPSVEKHAHPPRVVYCAIYPTLTRFTKSRVCNLHIPKGGYPVTLLPPPRRLAPSLGLGTTYPGNQAPFWGEEVTSPAIVIYYHYYMYDQVHGQITVSYKMSDVSSHCSIGWIMHTFKQAAMKYYNCI